jgi:hypothetical protein
VIVLVNLYVPVSYPGNIHRWNSWETAFHPSSRGHNFVTGKPDDYHNLVPPAVDRARVLSQVLVEPLS